MRRLLEYLWSLLARLFGRAPAEPPVVAPLVVALGLGAADAVQSGGGGPGPEGLITTLTLQNTSGSTQGANFIPHVVGMGFAKGDLSTGDWPVFKGAVSGDTYPATIWVRARWSDGSVKRIGALVLVTDSIAGSSDLDVEIYSGGSAPAASALSTSDLSAADLNVVLTGIENLTGTWTSSLNTGISDNDDLKLIADGPAGKVWRIRQQFRDASSNHGQLECYHYVAALQNESDGLYGVRWLPRTVQPWYDNDSPTKLKRGFTAAVKSGSTTLIAPTPGAAKTFSRLSGNYCTMTAHGMERGMTGRLTTTGTLPGGLSTGTTYAIRTTDDNTVQFFTKTSEATGIGTEVTITSAGSGTHTFTPHIEIVHGASFWGSTTDGKWQFAQGGGSASAEPTVRWKFPKAYLRSTKLIPPYDTSLSPTAPSTTQTYKPNGKGGLRYNFPDTGPGDQIGPQPAWVARHFMLQTANAEQNVRVPALSIAHGNLCGRQSSTGTVPVLNAASGTPYSGMGTATTSLRGWQYYSAGYTGAADDTAGCIVMDWAHFGGGSTYYAGLITGEPQYDDLMIESAIYAIANRYTGTDYPQRNDSTLGYYGYTWRDTYHIRDDAWSTLNITLAAAANTETHWDAAGLHTYLNALMTKNWEYPVTYNATQDSFWNDTGLFHFRASDGIGQPWMFNFAIYAAAFGYAVTENADALTMLRHFVKFPIACDADTDINQWTCYNNTMRSGDSGGSSLVTNINQIHWGPLNYSINAGTDVVTLSMNDYTSLKLTLTDGDTVRFGNTGAPTNLSVMTTYYVRDCSDPGTTSPKTFKLEASPGSGALDIGAAAGSLFVRMQVTPGTARGMGYEGDDQYHDTTYGAIRWAEALGETQVATIRGKLDTIIANDTLVTHLNTPTNAMSTSF